MRIKGSALFDIGPRTGESVRLPFGHAAGVVSVCCSAGSVAVGVGGGGVPCGRRCRPGEQVRPPRLHPVSGHRIIPLPA